MDSINTTPSLFLKYVAAKATATLESNGVKSMNLIGRKSINIKLTAGNSLPKIMQHAIGMVCLPSSYAFSNR
ncbi:hypothetical protein [Prevotella sp. KH2C16]|uniref:hypothetical protein n=1 Tax=Prevotella sp. KH2C16 TaxID=1855325 RepID=UPI001160CE54|nr:hypothetical protein [Prevotella sp. KH2C16]